MGNETLERITRIEGKVEMNRANIDKLANKFNDSLIDFASLKSTQKVILIISVATFGMMSTAFVGVIIKFLGK